jgi:hypothetical protein
MSMMSMLNGTVLLVLLSCTCLIWAFTLVLLRGGRRRR